MLQFQWSDAKNRTNRNKHGIDFETARLAFDDPTCLTFVERIVDGEQRWHAIGLVENVITLVVVHTFGKNRRQSDPHHFRASSDLA